MEKKKLLTNLYTCFFPVQSRKGDIGEGGVEKKEGKDNCIGRNRQVVSI